VGGQH